MQECVNMVHIELPPPIMAWEVKAAVRKMKNGKEVRKYQLNIEKLKAGDETITFRNN